MISALKKEELHFSEYLVPTCEITSCLMIADPNPRTSNIVFYTSQYTRATPAVCRSCVDIISNSKSRDDIFAYKLK